MLLLPLSCGFLHGHPAQRGSGHETKPAAQVLAYGEAVLPFTEDRDGIHVQASVQGKAVPALIDTGTSCIVWPSSLHLGGTPRLVRQGAGPPTPEKALLYGPTGEPLTGHILHLAQIRVGGMSLTSFDTIRLETYHKSSLRDCLLLGNTAFSRGSLTFDYPRRELIVRTKQYDPARVIRTPGSCVVPFTWLGKDDFGSGVPVIAAQVSGHPAHLILDMGAEGLVMRNGLALQMPLSSKLGDAGMTSLLARPQTVLLIRGLSVSVGTAVLKNLDGAVVPALLSGRESAVSVQDGSLGRALLKSYRLTIDYPRRCIVLEPYGSSEASIDKTESKGLPIH